MPLTLPSRPDLSRLRMLAKARLAAMRRGDPAALAGLQSWFGDATPATARLSQAQTVLARDYGLPAGRCWLPR